HRRPRRRATVAFSPVVGYLCLRMGELSVPPPDGAPAPPPPAPGRSVRERRAPAIPLGLGILSQTYAKHTIAFAPKAVALLTVAWALAAGLGEWLAGAKPGGAHPRW